MGTIDLNQIPSGTLAENLPTFDQTSSHLVEGMLYVEGPTSHLLQVVASCAPGAIKWPAVVHAFQQDDAVFIAAVHTSYMGAVRLDLFDYGLELNFAMVRKAYEAALLAQANGIHTIWMTIANSDHRTIRRLTRFGFFRLCDDAEDASRSIYASAIEHFPSPRLRQRFRRAHH